MPKKASQGNKADATDEANANVDKIRDILFGGQMRDYEQRFTTLEKRLSQNIENVGKDLERRIERLDTFAKREIEKLSEQIKTERKDRIADSKQGSGELNEFSNQVESWFAEVEEKLTEEVKDIREAANEQNNELTALMRQTQEQLQASLDRQTGELSDSKVAREDLAALLTEVALRLNKDFKLPKA
ncbi:hypothetical protein [Woeseia oceani]|uniref:Uncharacterized protein n=1 Tax=Woeseia oceani TaxID=1548547 RepID=A0A193LJ96_9GAMM|nr:hypothetical protein [Woeseia oceani]ANO52469.1 hypothetical protein BA177_15900 [Woeseia oceani]